MRSLWRTVIVLAFLVQLGSACAPTPAAPPPATAALPSATEGVAPAANTTAAEIPPSDLSPRPLYWFAPLPRLPVARVLWLPRGAPLSVSFVLSSPYTLLFVE
jgi:hypothetical protein